jgi:type III restriction enzyme
LPPLVTKKTVFNYVATYNDFERRFAEFLDNKAADVLRFAALGTTEQGESGTQFRVDYLKPSGAIGFYHPDWVVVQKTKTGEVNWIIETKGRVWEGTSAKDDAICDWCERVTDKLGGIWKYCRINQPDFESGAWNTFSEMISQI